MNTTGKNLIVNINQIGIIHENFVNMIDGTTIELNKTEMQKLTTEIFGDEKEANPKASLHTEELLNELNKLCGGTRDAKPTSDRKARLKTRLKDFTEEDLKIAAKNLGSNAFMQGDNENGKRYGTLDYLLRTSENVNKFLEEVPQKKKKGMF